MDGMLIHASLIECTPTELEEQVVQAMCKLSLLDAQPTHTWAAAVDHVKHELSEAAMRLQTTLLTKATIGHVGYNESQTMRSDIHVVRGIWLLSIPIISLPTSPLAQPQACNILLSF